MKQIFAALLSAILLFSCSDNAQQQTGKQVIALPIPNEMLTLKMQQKLQGQYDNVWDASEGFVAVLKDGKWGFVDTSGKVIIALQFEDPSQFHAGYAPVKKDGKTGVIDKTGKVVVPFMYDYVGDYQQGVFVARDFNKKYGYIDSANTTVIPFEYDDANVSWFGGGLAIMKKGKKYGAIDKTNKTVVPFEFEELGITQGFDLGHVVGRKTGKLLLIGNTGETVELPGIDTYESIRPLGESMFVVKDNTSGKEGIIDITGKAIIPVQYVSVSNFYKGYAVVETDKGRFLLDKKGTHHLEETAWLNLNVLTESLFYGNTSTDATMYLFDINGKHVVEEGFGNIVPLADDLLLVNKDGKAWYINYKGEKIADMQE